MSKLHQLHDRYGPVWDRAETDVLPGRHDRREKVMT